jgi:hypothetical protein
MDFVIFRTPLDTTPTIERIFPSSMTVSPALTFRTVHILPIRSRRAGSATAQTECPFAVHNTFVSG